MRLVAPSRVRAAIAAHVLGREPAPAGLGDVVLHQHQRDGLQRVRHLLETEHGVLLADDVGLGKTYVALAAARNEDTLVVAPAALRDTWATAATRTGVKFRFLSVESLSRGLPSPPSAELVVIDEAQHLRTPTTRRYTAARALCARAKVLLLSATPVQNRLADLRALLALFLGERAYALGHQELSQFVIRRDERSLDLPAMLRLPRLVAPRWLSMIEDVDCLDRLISLPRALPPIDGDDGGVLLTYTLARQWASSRGALAAALRRRLARGSAMHDALRAGRHPSRAELAAWSYADGTQQLVFPELIVHDFAGIPPCLLDQVQIHMDGVRDLLAWLRSTPDPDVKRAAILRQLSARHAGERIVAFSEYADTVSALYRWLLPHARVAALTHSGARVAGGTLTRREVLARFAPGASAATAASDHIDLLLTTDVLSEGVDLHDASVVVHLDLAWNPARLEQRVGRLRRIGASRDAVAVYMFPPPAPAERLLMLERRLRMKTSVAARSIGLAGAILPGLGDSDAGAGSASREERIAALLRPWRSHAVPEGAACGAVHSDRDAALACVWVDGAARLIAVLEDRITDSRVVVEDLLANAAGAAAEADAEELRIVVERVERWLRRRVVTEVLDLPALRVGRARRAVLRRVESISSRVPRHARSELAPLVQAARSAATAPLSAGAERVLNELAHAPLADRAWLQAVGEFAALHARGRSGASDILALLLLRARADPISSGD